MARTEKGTKKSRLIGDERLIQFEDSKEGFLGDFDVANLLHTFLTTFLFLEQFAFTADVTAITFGEDILANLLDSFASDYLRTDGGLNCRWQTLCLLGK